MSEIYRVTICRHHLAEMLRAAEGCGCSSEKQQFDFIADALEAGGLYHEVYALAGEAVSDQCLYCMLVYPQQAIDEAVIAALAYRAQHGKRERLN